MDLNSLKPKALAAAMKGGTAGWGQVASAADHVRYSQPVRPTSRRRCSCGCDTRATLLGMANGMALASGCALAIARWVKTGHTRSHSQRMRDAGFTRRPSAKSLPSDE